MSDIASSVHGGMMAVVLQPTADDRATDFKAVTDAPAGERYSGPGLVVAAYASIWVIAMIWVIVLWRKSIALTERLDGLERAIDRAAAANEKKDKASAVDDKLAGVQAKAKAAAQATKKTEGETAS